MPLPAVAKTAIGYQQKYGGRDRPELRRGRPRRDGNVRASPTVLTLAPLARSAPICRATLSISLVVYALFQRPLELHPLAKWLILAPPRCRRISRFAPLPKPLPKVAAQILLAG